MATSNTRTLANHIQQLGMPPTLAKKMLEHMSGMTREAGEFLHNLNVNDTPKMSQGWHRIYFPMRYHKLTIFIQ